MNGRRLGVVGFGRLARDYYMPALRTLGGDRVAVADPSASSREAARRAGVAAAYETVEALLQAERLDGVLVASPPSTHFEAWRAAAAHELPVFMEKPFPLVGDLARIDPADAACRRLMIDFNRRFWPAYQRLGAHLRSASIGRPLRARFTLHANVLAWSTVSRHRLDTAQGGVLHDLGSHVLDLVAIIFPERPATIAAQRSASGTEREAVAVTLAYPDGLCVECDLAYAGRNRESVHVVGKRGSLRMAEPNCGLWLERRPGPVRALVTRAVDLGLLGGRAFMRERSMLRASVRAALTAFLAALETDGPFSPGFTDARRVALWTAAAERALVTGRPEPLRTE